MGEIEVELVEHSPGSPYSGIGRYTRELHRHLSPLVSTRLTTQIDTPFDRYISSLHHLPLGVLDHRPGSIVHFVEDLGCSQMLWHPVHPSVATSHDLGFLAWRPEARMHDPVARVVWLLSYLGLKRMDAVIAVSEFSRQSLIRRLRIPAERVFAIHSGIDTAVFKPVSDVASVLEAHGISKGPGDRFLLYVGTEIPRKNMVTILNALKRLPPNVRLLKIGHAGHPRFREATKSTLVALGLSDRVHFVDQVSDDQLVQFYNAADVYICASYLEGFCHPVLEAMACGTPVVSSNVASLPEVAGNAAYLVPPTNDRAFADAIQSILSSQSMRREMSERGRERSQLFRWETTAREVLAVYEYVSGRNARTRWGGEAR